MKKRAGIIVYNLKKNYWVILNGGLEDNETKLEVGIRETYEELGIKITDTNLIQKAFNFENHFYFLL